MMLFRTSLLALMALPCLAAPQETPYVFGGFNFSESQASELGSLLTAGFTNSTFEKSKEVLGASHNSGRSQPFRPFSTDHQTTVFRTFFEPDRPEKGSQFVDARGLTYFMAFHDASDLGVPDALRREREFRVTLWARFLPGAGSGRITINNQTLTTDAVRNEWKRMGSFTSIVTPCSFGRDLRRGTERRKLNAYYGVPLPVSVLQSTGVNMELKYKVEATQLVGDPVKPIPVPTYSSFTWID